jgi:hypothetical protein
LHIGLCAIFPQSLRNDFAGFDELSQKKKGEKEAKSMLLRKKSYRLSVVSYRERFPPPQYFASRVRATKFAIAIGTKAAAVAAALQTVECCDPTRHEAIAFRNHRPSWQWRDG